MPVFKNIDTTKCDRMHCKAVPQWIPVLQFYAAKEAYKGRPVVPMAAPVSLTVCDYHKEITTLADLLTEALWKVTMKVVAKRQLAVPVRENTRFTFMTIDMALKRGII